MKKLTSELVLGVVRDALMRGYGVLWSRRRLVLWRDGRVWEGWHPLVLLAMSEGYKPIEDSPAGEWDYLSDYDVMHLVQFDVALYRAMQGEVVPQEGGFGVGREVARFLRECCVLSDRAAVGIKLESE